MANQNLQTTSVSITFASSVVGDGILVAELDSELNGEQNSFYYGDTVFFRVYRYPSNMSLTFDVSDGIISSHGNDSSDEKEYIEFVDTKEGSIGKPAVSGTFSHQWLGNDLGEVSVNSGNSLLAANKGIAVLKASYTSNYVIKGLTLEQKINPDTGEEYEEYPVVVFITGIVE